MNTVLLSTLGGIALLLAMVGIYGVVAYFVSQRTQEIGVRTALGATPADIWRFVVWRGMMPVAVGLAVGIALAFATSRLLSGQLYGVTARDPVTFIAVGVLLLLVAIVAMYVPARRAMRVSPVVALSA
jgi:putative ABC transport system permease protein